MSGFWEGERDEGWQKLAARLDEKTRQFWAIDSVSHAISESLTTEDLLRTSLARVVDVTGATAGAIYLAGSDGPWRLAISHNFPSEATPISTLLEVDNPLVKTVIGSKEPVTWSVLKDLSEFSNGRLAEVGLYARAAVAMSALEVTQGMLILYDRDIKPLDKANLEVLRVIGHLIGLSLGSAMAHELALAKAELQVMQRVAEMEGILSSMSDGLLICDSEGRIVRANGAAVKVLSCFAPELIGQSVLTPQWNHLVGQLQPSANETHGPLAGVILHGEECKDCLLEMDCLGEKHTISLSAAPLHNSEGASGGAVVIVRDVTQEKRTQQKQEEFLSLLSHELRAPLTVISGYAQMMSRRLSRQGLAEEAASAELIKAQVKRMSGMVSDLVESGRLEEGLGAISREEIDLGALVEIVTTRVMREQHHAGEKHIISLEVAPDLPPVEADTGRLDQVLTNILSNAIRYSPDGGRVQVKVEREFAHLSGNGAHTLEMVRVSVTDEGIGIPEAERPYIFERAFRGKRAMGVSGQGLGLGLYICKLIIEAQSGHIGLVDGPGGIGTTFWFTLPVAHKPEDSEWTY